METQIRITWTQFVSCILDIVKLSDQLLDDWIIEGDVNKENEAFLTKKVRGDDHVHLMTKDDKKEILTYEYHIIYNISYEVPELYFNIYRQDGSLLSLGEYTMVLNFDSNLLYTSLTQKEHPILFRPFFSLHPCRTAALIGNCFKSSQNIVVSWLSAIGPLIGLYLRQEYGKVAEIKL